MSANGQGMGVYPPANTHPAGYGSVNYPISNMQDIQSMDTRRRVIEALNDLLADIKRRALDPQIYYVAGQSAQGTALSLPVDRGDRIGYSGRGLHIDYNTVSVPEAFTGRNTGGGGGGAGNMHNPSPFAPQDYSLPLLNARTNNDLQNIDRFLDQLQATV